MLTPLFSPGCDLVGWMQPQKFLFDTDMAYAAFITNSHAWSARSGRWIGPVIGSHVFDVDGRAVAWNPGAPLRGFGRPLRPVNVVRAVSPVRPPKPIAPARPLTAPALPGGWSPLTFAEWLVSSDPKPEEIIETIVEIRTGQQQVVVDAIEVTEQDRQAAEGANQAEGDTVK